jgi:WD40 repeat protein
VYPHWNILEYGNLRVILILRIIASVRGHENVISACTTTMDERKFATASWDKMINIWDIATGMYRSKGPTALKGCHDGSVLACDFTDDGVYAIVEFIFLYHVFMS